MIGRHAGEHADCADAFHKLFLTCPVDLLPAHAFGFPICNLKLSGNGNRRFLMIARYHYCADMGFFKQLHCMRNLRTRRICHRGKPQKCHIFFFPPVAACHGCSQNPERHGGQACNAAQNPFLFQISQRLWLIS